MIVEGENGGHTLPSAYLNYRSSLESSTALLEFLPHRSNEERAAILRAFAGVTTWRAVMDALHVPDAVLIDRLPEDGA